MPEDGTGGPYASESAAERTGSLIERLATQTVTALGELLPPGTTSVALLDFPYHRNSGDSAIWLGVRRTLERLGVRVAYVSDTARYRPDRLREALPVGPILLLGGGNFGDLWPGHQELRVQVLRDFPDRTVIQLPQSIAFRDDRALDEARRVTAEHPDFVFMVRERRSLAFAQENFDVRVVLAPDSAFANGPLSPPRPVRPEGVLCLARDDVEGTGLINGVVGPGIRRADWVMPRVPELRWKAARGLPKAERHLLGRHGVAYRAARPALYAAYESMARVSVETATGLLCTARYVVTDRLHAHVLCLLLGIRHTVFDNSYGKVGGTYEAWTSGSDIARWATSADEALAHCSRYAS
ncbi:polysaccharide pyruvyl transferase [Parafrankia colletiae]|uniref:Polysaccharide pyruvyl transferase n=1 Tax=Parafrankia colletiae TaxID=573497 RepID=A0A1S1QDX7_9ACTN|nr:polysaccharide pyruvyl transferase family protein [Parafrankia colletiae]MCK9900280.1 polysaccharide pyruvyl transferase family protein [Frankia sp. Cpl3]OHV30464.1 polysaccharide pyruvyl transferase [Parafrankia colletiae]